LEAIRAGFTSSSLDGGDLNEEALEVLVIALVGEVNESAVRVSLHEYTAGLTTYFLLTKLL
jgi:hypothetical protein